MTSEVKIVYLFFFQENTSTKFLSFLLFYYPVCWLKISSAFAIIFADSHGLSCVHVRARWYTAPFWVSLRGVGPRCVGLAGKVSSRCKTDSYFFFTFYLFVFYSLSCIITHVCDFNPLSVFQNWPELKPFLSLFVFKKPLLFITLFLKIMCFYLLFISIRTWKVPIRFFVSWLPKTVFATTSIEKSKAVTSEKFAFSLLAVEGKSM